MPKVSVIIPTYNRMDTLGAAIESVQAQSFKDFEIIVVDHGSTDGTFEWLGKTYGSAVRALRTENCPLPACPRNTGIKAAQGDTIAFLDSDDLWLPDKLVLQIKALDANPEAGWSYGNAVRFGDPSQEGILEIGPWQFHAGRVFNDLLRGSFIPTCTVMVRRRCLDAVGPFDMTPQLKTSEDYELWMRLAYHFDVVPIRRAIARYRVYPGNLSADLSKRFEPESKALELIENKLHPPEALMRQARAALHLRLFRYTLSQDPQGAAPHLQEARALDPGRLRTRVYTFLMAIGGAGVFSVWFRLEKIFKQILSLVSFQRRR
jgi:glycosyltransferase involved in cell wall biosynthesis